MAGPLGSTGTSTLQFSKDGGQSWNGLASGLAGTEYQFDLSALPSGDVVFALMAHDGFHSSRSISDPIPLLPRAPVVAIMHPFNGDTLREGQPLRLWASASTGSSCPVANRLCRWTLDGQDVGHGLEMWITTPGAGEHRCSIIVEEDGHRAERTRPSSSPSRTAIRVAGSKRQSGGRQPAFVRAGGLAVAGRCGSLTQQSASR